MDNQNNSSPANKVPFDPGWNDPPPVAYKSQQASKPRNFLNKRVAFPLSGGIASPSPAPTPQTPPIGLATPPSAHPRCLQKDTESEELIDSEKTLAEVKAMFSKVLEDSAELNVKSNDIKRRLGVMEDMWQSGKLNSKIQVHLRDLANALVNEPKKADNIHQLLMVQHVSAVGSWMPAVRQLIYSCIARSELLPIDSAEST